MVSTWFSEYSTQQRSKTPVDAGQNSMRETKKSCSEETLKPVLADLRSLKQVVTELCDQALFDAKAHLHPLLHNAELDKLDSRSEFVQAFKRALEKRIALQLVSWQPCIQAVYGFNATLPQEGHWDNTIHLLVLLSQPLESIQALSLRLDLSLIECLKQLNWSRFQMHETLLDIQQVTPDEIRRGIRYGAMFSSVYNAPFKIWTQRRVRLRQFKGT